MCRLPILRSTVFVGCVVLQLLAACAGHLIFKDGFVGIGLNLPKLGLGSRKDKDADCPPYGNITCVCSDEGTPVAVPVPLCSYMRRWKVRCKPCNDMSPEKVCPRYKLCAQCSLDGGNSCVSCPHNKFGTWCENTCTCQNGGVCDRGGKCSCPSAYDGKNCETKKTCPTFKVAAPLLVDLEPPDSPFSAVFSCQPDFVLSGQAISTCVHGKWSSEPPTCRPECPLLSAPANGRLEFSSNDLIEGVTAEVECNRNYRLVGKKTLNCTAKGRWNGDLPYCEEMETCPDPGNVEHAEQKVLPGAMKIGERFVQRSVIQYKCWEGYEQMGLGKMLCRLDGTWSSRLPSCIKVATTVPSCETTGSDVFDEEGISVRIVCPPECADEEFKVWGTSIYRARSSVCQAAIHSAKITNSGGAVAVINNGPYSHFTGSYSNYIESESSIVAGFGGDTTVTFATSPIAKLRGSTQQWDTFPDRDDSFRFERLSTPLPESDEDCEKALTRLAATCIYVSNLLRSYEEAEAVCSNLGLRMELPSDPEEKLKLATILNTRGIRSIWADKKFATSAEDKNIVTEAPERDNIFCPLANTEELEFKLQRRSCQEIANYVCMHRTDAKRLAMCSDPGPIDNGVSQAIGKINNIFFVGSSIEFSCNKLYYLKGEKTISCTANGTWLAEKPECVKVDACEDPPIPQGGFVTYLPPLKTSTAQRSAIHHSRLPQSSRAARLPIGLAAPIPQDIEMTSTPEPITVALPDNLHRLGTRAMYDCESNYYNLIGSRVRTCQATGKWSGRPPTCMPVCGRSDSPRSPFIVNGNATDIGQWPWQAGIARYLQDYSRWFLLCGASLVNELWIITAAHCVTYAGTTLTIEPDKFQVYLGKYHRLDSKDDEYVQVRKIQEIHIHPDYDPGLFDADIAVIQLDSPVQLNSRVQPVCLPTEQTTRDNLVEGTKGVVTGWGMNENETYSNTLQQAVLPVVSHITCERGYENSELPLTVTSNMYCAGYAKGRSDACSGDSGGPMVFTDNNSRARKWVLEGIVSWGSPRGCGNPNQYGGFTKVSKFLDWIHLYF